MIGLSAVTGGCREGVLLESAYRRQIRPSPVSFRLNTFVSRFERFTPLSVRVRRVCGELRVVPRKHGLSSPLWVEGLFFLCNFTQRSIQIYETAA